MGKMRASRKTSCSASFVLLCLGYIAPTSGAQTPAGQQAADASNELPKNAIVQHSPCTDQPRSMEELTNTFKKGRVPSTSEIVGTWVAIGTFSTDGPSLNCSGLMRGNKLEGVLDAGEGYVDTHIIGVQNQTTPLVWGKEGALTFDVDFGGEGHPVFRCRLTPRATLTCLVGGEGWEFMKMSVDRRMIYNQKY